MIKCGTANSTDSKHNHIAAFHAGQCNVDGASERRGERDVRIAVVLPLSQPALLLLPAANLKRRLRIPNLVALSVFNQQLHLVSARSNVVGQLQPQLQMKVASTTTAAIVDVWKIAAGHAFAMLIQYLVRCAQRCVEALFAGSVSYRIRIFQEPTSDSDWFCNYSRRYGNRRLGSRLR